MFAKKNDVNMSTTRKDQLINEQRKKLQQIRLQTQSENTKLLKIQQKERQVQTQYQNQKKNMEQTLSKLSLQAEKFMKKQLQTTQQFESQKQQIFANDRKKQTYLKQQVQLEQRNAQRKKQIEEQQKKLKDKKQELQDIRGQIKVFQIYEDFLRQVRNSSDDFGSSELDQFSGMSILERYKTMEKKKVELAQLYRKVGLEKQNRIKSIQQIKKIKQEKILSYGAKIKQLKEKMDGITQQNLYLQNELQGKLNQNGERQRELGQVIFSIRGLYLSIVGQQKQQKSANQKTIIQMLKVIRQERKKLGEYLQLFMSKTQEKKKNQK